VEKALKVFLVLIALGTAGGPAQAQSRQIVGTAGYLSEWELKGAVTEKFRLAGVSFPDR